VHARALFFHFERVSEAVIFASSSPSILHQLCLLQLHNCLTSIESGCLFSGHPALVSKTQTPTLMLFVHPVVLVPTE
jgi:hypothetical protein